MLLGLCCLLAQSDSQTMFLPMMAVRHLGAPILIFSSLPTVKAAACSSSKTTYSITGTPFADISVQYAQSLEQAITSYTFVFSDTKCSQSDVVYSYSVFSDSTRTTPIYPAFFSIDTQHLTIDSSTTIFDVGVYYLTLDILVSSNIGQTDSTDFTVTITSPCFLSSESPKLTVSNPGEDQQYTQKGSGSFSFSAFDVTSASICTESDIVYTIESTPTNDYFTINSSSRTIAYDTIGNCVDYTIVVTGTITTQASQPMAQDSITFTCGQQCSSSIETITIVGTPLFTSYYQVGDGSSSVTFEPFTLDSSICTASDFTYSIAVTAPNAVSDTSWIDISGTTITWDTSNVGDVGIYSIDITASLPTTPIQSNSISFTLEVDNYCTQSYLEQFDFGTTLQHCFNGNCEDVENYQFWTYKSSRQLNIEVNAISCEYISETIEFTVLAADGLNILQATDDAIFQVCQDAHLDSCIGFDSSSQYTLNLLFWGETFTGANTVTILFNFVGQNRDGSTFIAVNTATYAFTLNVASCGTTVFGDLTETDNPMALDSTALKINADASYYIDFTISDSITVDNGGNYCGSRSVEMTAVDGDANQALAQQLLDNGELTIDGGYAVSLYIQTSDATLFHKLLQFHIDIYLSKYNSIRTEFPNQPTTGYDFSVYVLPAIDCMQTKFQPLVNWNTTGLNSYSFNGLYINVKNYYPSDTTDIWDSSNFYTSRYYVRSYDSVSMQQEQADNSTTCGKRSFEIVVAASETNELAAALLPGTPTTGQLSVENYALDDFTAQINLKIFDDLYTGLQLHFTLNVYLDQYHSIGTTSEPVGSLDFSINIQACNFYSSSPTPTVAQPLSYYITKGVTSLVYNLQQVPNCTKPARLTMTVDTMTDQTEIADTYGISVTQSSSTDYKSVTVTVSLDSSNLTLADSSIAFSILTWGRQSQALGIVKIDYICQVDKIVLKTTAATSYSYTIGSKMTPLSYVLKATPACAANDGVMTVLINGSKVTDLSLYGLNITQTLGDDNSTITFTVQSNYKKSDLDGSVFQISISFAVGAGSYTFTPITATYTTGIKVITTKQDPPTFIKSLNKVPIIPCLDSETASVWNFQFPTASDPNDLQITYTWSCDALKGVVQFNKDKTTLTLLQGTLPQNGDNSCNMKLSNPSGAKTQYTLSLTVLCTNPKDKGNFNDKNVSSTIPIPVINQLTQTGDLYIYWSQPMVKTNINGFSTLSSAKVRKLEQNNTQKAAINLIYTQNSDPVLTDTKNLDFQYELSWMSDKTTYISINFDNPQYVSSLTSAKDELSIQFVNPEMFKALSGSFVDPNTTLSIKIPKQMPKGSFILNVQTVKNTGLAVMGTSVALQFILSAVVNQLLGIIENLVLIIHYFILTLEYPANVQNFVSALFPLVIFDVFPVQPLHEQMFHFSEIPDKTLSDQFDEVGYGSMMVVENMGSLYLISIVLFTFTIVLTIIPSCCYICLCKKYVQPRVTNYLQDFYWNGLIQFIDQNYIFFTVMSMIELSDLRLGPDYSATEQYNSLLAIFMIIVLAAFPLVIVVIYKRKIRACIPLPDLEDTMQIETIQYLYKSIDIPEIQKNVYFQSQHDKFMRTYGCLIEKIDLQKIGVNKAIMAAVLPNVRKLAFASIVMLTLDRPILCLILFNYTSLAQIVYISYNRVYKDKWDLVKAQFAEVVLLLLNYGLYCLTDWLYIDQQIWVGQQMIYLIIAACAIEFFVAMIPVAHEAKIKYLRRQYRKAQKAKKAQNSKKEKKEKNTVQVEVEPVENQGPEESERKLMLESNQKRKIVVTFDNIDHRIEPKTRRKLIVEPDPEPYVAFVAPNQSAEVQLLQQRFAGIVNDIEKRLASIESVGSLEDSCSPRSLHVGRHDEQTRNNISEMNVSFQQDHQASLPRLENIPSFEGPF